MRAGRIERGARMAIPDSSVGVLPSSSSDSSSSSGSKRYPFGLAIGLPVSGLLPSGSSPALKDSVSLLERTYEEGRGQGWLAYIHASSARERPACLSHMASSIAASKAILGFSALQNSGFVGFPARHFFSSFNCFRPAAQADIVTVTAGPQGPRRCRPKAKNHRRPWSRRCPHAP